MKTKFVILVEVESDTLENAERDLKKYCQIKTQDNTLAINGTDLLSYELIGEMIRIT